MPALHGGSRKALVLYGSETGNAQDAAEELGRLLRRFRFASVVDALDAASLDDLHNFDVLIVSISTTGQGDVPRNGQAFWKKLLRKKLPPTLLSGVRFGVYGLGDRSYPNFNYAALKLSKRLTQLGATELLPIGAADEQHPEGNDATFIPWSNSLQTQLHDLFPLKDSEDVISESMLLQPAWLLSTTKDVPSTATADGQLALQGEQPSTVRLNVKLESNRRVTSQGHWQDVRHLEFSTESQLDYAPGDILEIQPKNPPSEVQQLLELLGWHEVADVLVGFSRNPNYPTIPVTSVPVLHPYRATKTMTLRQILTECIDINGIPKRSFFRLIAHFTNDAFHRERLEEFANPELTDELFDYTTRPRRSILEVLQEFDTVKIPWQWLFEVFPPLRPRQFSIASGGDLKLDARGFTRFELLVAIVKYRTVIRKLRRGTCTRYLEDLEPGAALDVALVRGSLGINRKNAHIPLLMVGPGTGVAPLRALLWEKQIWERSYILESSGSNLAPNPAAAHSGSNILFFGCRNATSDFFFKEEWDRLKTNIPLDVFAAFSRDQQQKVYVQDLLLKQKQLVFDMLYRKGGFICVCGSSGKMPAAVRATLTDIFEENLGCPRPEAEAYLRAMEKAERYKQETW